MALIFKPVLCEAILEGRKVLTRRPLDAEGKHPYAIGQRHAVLPGMARHGIATVEVVACRTQPLLDITNEGADGEGFPTRQAFIDYWRQLYPRSDLTERVVAIQFKLVEVKATICVCCTGTGTHPVERSKAWDKQRLDLPAAG